ncbi:hypothetical protein HTV45_10245 [Streptomyces sp. CHD11]|uniref:hypothetical protein n=1 Tax=Streptomyces sp. CHD11 TaxID=2741325 RepID=UPI001BFC2635|nr:hypothetical protein [Streptomyces sp. CHD11]MBT3151258.1 hypothetical protein [Streptomyces sp. CHD11]
MSGPVRAHLMTRGTLRGHDYTFLGDSPAEQWWDTVAGWVFMESEELIVRRNGESGAGLVISGIPSRRTDVLGTRVRHTVVLDDAQHDQRLAMWLVRCGLDDTERRRLGEALDAAFEADFVDALMSGADGDAGAVGSRLLDALRRAAGEQDAPEEEEDLTGSWAGPVHDEEAGRAFTARVRHLLSDGASPGYAFTTHALGTLDGVRRVASELPDDVAVLLHDGNLRGVERLKKAPVPAPRRDRATVGGRTRTLALALIGAAMTLGIWWLIRQL